MKICNKCKQKFSKNNFYKDKTRNDKLSTICKKCSSNKNKILYLKNNKKILEKHKQWHLNNPNYNKARHERISDKHNQSKPIIEKDGYYHADGMKTSSNYYERVWKQGRPAPFVQAREIINSNPKITLDPRGREGFYRYESSGLEMIYNPKTKEIWHIQPVR